MTRPILFTFWPSVRETRGTRYCVTWETLAKALGRFTVLPHIDHKRAVPGWSPAIFVDDVRAGSVLYSDGRRLEACGGVFALVLDYDGGATLEEACHAWSAWAGLIHTTASHTTEAPRFRVVLPYARAVAPEEHRRVYKWALARSGGACDVKTSDPSRLWFLPSVVRDGRCASYRFASTAWLDPDAALRERAQDALRERVRRAAPSCERHGHGRRGPDARPAGLGASRGEITEARLRAYAQRALSREVARVRAAVVGQRQNQLNASAYKLGRLLGGACRAVLTPADAARALYDAARAAGLDDKETRDTIRCALRAGARSPRGPK